MIGGLSLGLAIKRLRTRGPLPASFVPFIKCSINTYNLEVLLRHLASFNPLLSEAKTLEQNNIIVSLVVGVAKVKDVGMTSLTMP